MYLARGLAVVERIVSGFPNYTSQYGDAGAEPEVGRVVNGSCCRAGMQYADMRCNFGDGCLNTAAVCLLQKALAYVAPRRFRF